MSHFGIELLKDPGLPIHQRWYIRVFGLPISGLRIRLRRVLPELWKLARERRLPSEARIADLGCGNGVFTFELSRIFPDATISGMDIDAAQIGVNQAVARASGAERVRFVVQDILQLRAADAFDLILSVDNLEHIENDRAALTTFFSALKPGGLLLCHVPGSERTWLFFGRKPNFDVRGHFRPGYGSEELRSKLEAAGFRVVWLRESYGWLETVTNNLSYLVTGAQKRNPYLYALVFPLLNALAWVGRRQDPRGKGAAWIALAERPR